MIRYAVVLSGRVVGVLVASTPPTLNIIPGISYWPLTQLPEVTVGWFCSGGVFSEGTVTQKQQFLASMQAHMTELGQVVQRSQALVSAFVDRGYDGAAADPITDADLQIYGVIQYDLGAAVNLLQALKALTDQAVNEATISKWRQL